MILHWLELASFGRFLDSARFNFAADRPNLLAGPNGSGKSTILAALSAAFVIPHRSASDDIRRWQPWDRDLAPRVIVELQSSGKRYRLSKTFLAHAHALLEEEGPQGFSPVAEGDAVEQRLSEFLGGVRRPGVDPRSRQWLAAGVLWVSQNALAQLQVEQPIQTAVRASFGAQTRTGPFQKILDEAKQRYDEFWTPTGRIRKGSPVDVLRAQREPLERDLAVLRPKLEQLDRLRESVAALGDKAAGLEVQLRLESEALKQLEQSAASRGKLQSDREMLVLQQKEKQSEYRRLKEILDARATFENRWREHAERLRQLEEDAPRAASALSGAEQDYQHACRRVLESLEAAVRRMEDLRAPSAETLRRLEEISGQIAALEAKLESALLRAELEPEQDLSIQVLEGEPAGWMKLQKGRRAQVSGSPRIELDLPGIGRLRLSGPAESAAQLRDRIGSLRAEWTRLAEPFGETLLGHLHDRRRRADELQLEIDRLRQARRAHEEGRSPEAMTLAAARKEKSALDLRLLEEQRTRRTLEEEGRRLQSEPRPDAEIRQTLDRLALESHGLSEHIRRLDAELAGFAPDLDENLRRAHSAAESLRRSLDASCRELDQAKLRLAGLQGEAIYSAIAAREAALEDVSRKLAAAETEASARKLLKATLEEVLQEAESQVLPQVERRASAIFARLTSGFAEQVALNADSWQPQAVRPAELQVRVAPDRISGGEQEQLHLAVRFALADILAENEPQLVVLDDVLLATDSARLGRILELINERRRRMQFLILTCHSERFSELSDAHLIRLAAAAP